MAKRLVRAKRKIKAARIAYRAPADHELPDRLPPVLAVIYLVYNAGLTSSPEPSLCSEAIRLARILAGLTPDECEVSGLLALLLFDRARLSSTNARMFCRQAIWVELPGRGSSASSIMCSGFVRVAGESLASRTRVRQRSATTRLRPCALAA
jgi:hypothetical protein